MFHFYVLNQFLGREKSNNIYGFVAVLCLLEQQLKHANSARLKPYKQ